MFYADDDSEAKAVAAQLARDNPETAYSQRRLHHSRPGPEPLRCLKPDTGLALAVSWPIILFMVRPRSFGAATAYS